MVAHAFDVRESTNKVYHDEKGRETDEKIIYLLFDKAITYEGLTEDFAVMSRRVSTEFKSCASDEERIAFLESCEFSRNDQNGISQFAITMGKNRLFRFDPPHDNDKNKLEDSIDTVDDNKTKAIRANLQQNHEWCYEYERLEHGIQGNIEWFRTYAIQGIPDAQYNVGWCYENGEGVEKNIDEAVRWYLMAAEKENIDAQVRLGFIYSNKGFFTHDKKDYLEAAKWFILAAEQGNIDAQREIGEMYYKGEGVGKDYSKAIIWFRKAADQGDARAMDFIGDMYVSGRGVTQNFFEAEKWWNMAIETDDDVLQDDLGVLSLASEGRGAKQEGAEAVRLYTMAADNGSIRAMFKLSDIYNGGWGVDEDMKESARWLQIAAELGNAEAQRRLAICYEEGFGVEQDEEEAIKWYCRSARQGDFWALQCLKSKHIEVDDFEEEALNGIATTALCINKSYAPYYLFFDTETSGTPLNYDVPASDTRNWPRLVQLGWILTDEKGNTISSGCDIVKPDGFVIPSDAVKIHGITTEKAMREGLPLRVVINKFMADVNRSKIIVGHNISFDQKIVGAELHRLGIPDTISTTKSICTMKASTDFCKIPGFYKYKWPQLHELYRKLFGKAIDNAHDAMVDIIATKECFFELVRLGIINSY